MIDFKHADAKPLFERGVSTGVRLLIFALISLTFMVLDYRQGHLGAIRSALSVVVYPLRVAVDFPFNASRSLSRNFAERSRLLEENERLRQEALATNLKLQRYASLEAENTRLRALMDSTAHIADRVLVSEIMAVDLDRFRHRIVINKGTTSGAFKGQALLDAHGIVGQITQAEPLTSEAILVSDAAHAIPIEVNRNGLRTIAFGSGNLNLIRLPYLPNNADIEIGDLLMSSGLGGTFPSGYPVAVVQDIDRDPGKAFATVEARPAADLNRNREVLLVWSRDSAPTTPGEAEDTAQPYSLNSPPQEPQTLASELGAPPADDAP
ncbi:MAG: rod shape-determining protein MreC [Pseudomonadota bacterium]